VESTCSFQVGAYCGVEYSAGDHAEITWDSSRAKSLCTKGLAERSEPRWEPARFSARRWKRLSGRTCWHATRRRRASTLPRKARRELRALSPEEAKRFLAAAAEDGWFALWALLITTGLRPGEAGGLRWAGGSSRSSEPEPDLSALDGGLMARDASRLQRPGRE
jgi:integrase